MVRKISLNNVASYKKPTVLETDKKENLIYGLNGTGKSVLSDYLYKPKEDIYKDCRIEGIDDNHEILVYNQTFIHENFFESENLKGIFTLSKTNKDAKTKIANAQNEIKKIGTEKEMKEKELQTAKKDFDSKQETAKDKVWKIKTDYTGGDRVLEFCLEGYKKDGKKLLDLVEGLTKPANKPAKTIETIKEEVQGLTGDNAQKYDILNPILFSAQNIELESLFNKQIVGNENSTVSELINKLGNSDWVKDGLKYLPAEIENEREICPFCQESTISRQLFHDIKDYFDESYEADINSLKTFLKKYSETILSIPDKSTFEANPKYEKYKKDFELKYNIFLKVVNDNLKQIEDKIKSPSVAVTLKDSVSSLGELNGVIENINNLIIEHNKKIDKKETALEEIKNVFWEIMRWDYDQTISTFISDKTQSQKNIAAINKALQDIEIEIRKQKEIIVEQQKHTVNIEEAVTNINSGLIDLGIEDLKIKHHSENLYKLVREQNDNRIFHSLSEGEKMIISFLYFIELCKGKKDTTEAGKKKIIVIDDPISSLSHIYVFNVGRLIKNEYFGKKETKNGVVNWNHKYEQVFILTHSLYFFYEITETKHEERKEIQKLFRLTKNENGSSFISMSYEEIQNDYQAYWFIIKDEKQSPALIANCMRNIIEYFFNFVEKKDLNNFFSQEPLSSNRFQAFYRYINRESHSLGQNIYDLKEFNYKDFKDAFEELFKVAGYEEHYRKMIK
jgi:wobble nucleotide-excising tRNase